jgi:hypothetical protein
MKKKGKLGLTLNIEKAQEGEIITEHSMSLPASDDLFEVDDGVFVSGFTAAK